MRIGLICDRYDPGGGGAERNVVEVAEGLVARGHAVTILAGSGDAPGVGRAYRVERFAEGRTRSAGQLRRFRRWAERGFDAGRFDTSLSMVTTVPAAVIQPLGGTVAETQAQNAAAERRAIGRLARGLGRAVNAKRRALRAAERATMADGRVRLFAALSGYVVEQLERHYGVEPGRVRLIPNAVSTPIPDEAERVARRAAMRSELGVGEADVAYLFSAYNPRLKGAFPLLRAWGKVRAAGVAGALVMTGRTPGRLKRRAAALGLGDSVRWVGPTDRMLDHYCAADVLVHPTFYDPASRVVIEALRLGTPAITTRFNGAADFMYARGGAPRGRIVARPEDADALAGAMIELADPEARRACGEAMAEIEAEFDFDRHVDQLESALRSAAWSASPPTAPAQAEDADAASAPASEAGPSAGRESSG